MFIKLNLKCLELLQLIKSKQKKNNKTAFNLLMV